jgi:hypothetical protein
MDALWLYVGALLLAIVAVNVFVMRTIRAEKHRERERHTAERRGRSA